MNSDKNLAPSIIRVSLANLTSVVAEMVQQSFQQHPDIRVIGNFKEWEKLDASMLETDFLILGVDDVYSLSETCFHSLNNYPNLKIMLLTSTHDAAIVYWRSLHCHPIQVTSSQSLIESIRQLYCLESFSL